MLNFEKFKSRGWVCLDKVNTEKLLEISEDAKASLAIMLTSKHVAPLRDEAASWAVKLKEVGEVLEQVRSTLNVALFGHLNVCLILFPYYLASLFIEF